MTSRGKRLVAWTMCGSSVALAAAALVFLVLSLHQPAQTFGFRGGMPFVTISFAAVGILIALRRPDTPIGWVLLAASFSAGVQSFAQEYAVYALLERGRAIPGGAIAGWIDTWQWCPTIALMGIYLPLLFPSGRLLSPRWRIVAVAGAIGTVAFSAALALFPGPIQTTAAVQNPFAVAIPAGVAGPLVGIAALPFGASIAAAVASLVVRFRRSRGDERQQIKWLAVGGILTALSLLAVGATSIGRPGGLRPFQVVAMLSISTIPVATGIAILKHRLYDIDVVVNRALVYGLLGAFITAVYVAIVVGVGAVVGTGGGVVLPGVAAAVVALAFQPARQRARHLANRLVYGKRATPYEVLSEFSDRLGETYSVEDVLPRMAELLREGTGALRATVWVRVGDRLIPSASAPPDETGQLTTSPVADAGLGRVPGHAVAVRRGEEMLGALSVEKAKGDPLTPAEERLLEDLAGQAGLVLRNVRLTEELKANLEELRASRQRIVAAQDEERRRIERNIHDGAQQQLVALAVKLRLVESLSAKDPQKAGAMAAEAKGELLDALENLRDLARGIYPPLLADKGLAAALEAQARKSTLPVAVSVDGVGRYPQEVEAAIYFCVLEALQNAAKYSEAATVEVRLGAEDGSLLFSVRDDGRGFDVDETPKGSGLQNIQDRLSALGGSFEVRSEPGGGTVVAGRVPAQPAVAAAQAPSSRSGSNSDFGM